MQQLSDATLAGMTNSCNLVKHLFAAEIRRLDGMLIELGKSNDRAIDGQPSAGFMYKGDYFLRADYKNPPAHGERKVLVPDLWDQMGKYQEETSKLLMDIHKINQMTFRLVKGCNTAQDIRDALPECLVNVSAEMRQLPRTNQEGWTILGDERAVRQFEKVKPLMEFYSATSLMY